MKKSNSTATLQARKRELQDELLKIKTIEEQEIINQHYPAIKKKFAGKYFKCKNRYSGDDFWWLYTKIIEIKPEDVYDTGGNGVTFHFHGWSFQTCAHGKIEIEQQQRGYGHLLEVQITEKEFITAYNKMIKKMDALK